MNGRLIESSGCLAMGKFAVHSDAFYEGGRCDWCGMHEIHSEEFSKAMPCVECGARLFGACGDFELAMEA